MNQFKSKDLYFETTRKIFRYKNTGTCETIRGPSRIRMHNTFYLQSKTLKLITNPNSQISKPRNLSSKIKSALALRAKEVEVFDIKRIQCSVIKKMNQIEGWNTQNPLTPINMDKGFESIYSNSEDESLKLIISKQNIRPFPRCVFVISSEHDDIYIRNPNQYEFEYEVSKNKYLISSELFHLNQDYIKCSRGYIHPSLLNLIKKEFSEDITATDAIKLCEGFYEAYTAAFGYPYDEMPSMFYKHAA